MLYIREKEGGGGERSEWRLREEVKAGKLSEVFSRGAPIVS